MTSYHGGKTIGGKILANTIADLVNKHSEKNFTTYWEPFCGMCGVFRHIPKLLPKNIKLIASDIHPSLILMWQSLQNDWIPPKVVTKEMYLKLKYQDKSSPEKAFVGFGYSFGGIYFNGFVQDYGMKPSTNKDKRLIFTSKRLKDVVFEHKTYEETIPDNFIIYCDPPYSSSKHSKFYMDDLKYEKFDHLKFWNWARKLSENNLVIISEYKAPDNFIPIYNRQISSRRGGKKKIEYLFIHKKWSI